MLPSFGWEDETYVGCLVQSSTAPAPVMRTYLDFVAHRYGSALHNPKKSTIQNKPCWARVVQPDISALGIRTNRPQSILGTTGSEAYLGGGLKVECRKCCSSSVFICALSGANEGHSYLARHMFTKQKCNLVTGS